MSNASDKVSFHNWTDENGEVLILRRIPKNRTTRNNFVWPEGVGVEVECPDWNPNAECGGGLHGWPLGFGLGDGCEYDIIDDIWLVVGCKPEDVVGELGGRAKCKFRRGVTRLEGSFFDAMAYVRKYFEDCVAAMAKESTGDSSMAAASGDSSMAAASGNSSRAAASGNSSTAAASGNSSRAAASGNSSKAASSGEYSTAAASGNYSKAAASGQHTIAAVCGLGGRVRVGENGAFAISYWDDDNGYYFITGKVGENGIKPDTWYEVINGSLAEAK